MTERLRTADPRANEENVDPFVDALREISGEESELLVAYDTALQRWGAYRRFLDLVECQWHVETQLEGGNWGKLEWSWRLQAKTPQPSY